MLPKPCKSNQTTKPNNNHGATTNSGANSNTKHTTHEVVVEVEAEEKVEDMAKTYLTTMEPTPKVGTEQHMVCKEELYKEEHKATNKG